MTDTPVRKPRSKVRISRYELPTYTVKVHPDRAYYLPGQNASVEVRADYLFGKPVQRAKVKVVRQENRHWDSEKQEWVADESQALEGELDSDGKFTAHVDLTGDFHDFKEYSYQRFEDVNLAAYVTDLSTKRTEQRRFKLRLSAQPIHLYLSTAGTITADTPFVLYVTSSYADGTPASVDGVVEAARSDSVGQFDEEPSMSDRVPLGKFHTNHYGVGRVELQPLPKDLLTAVERSRLSRMEFASLDHAPGPSTATITILTSRAAKAMRLFSCEGLMPPAMQATTANKSRYFPTSITSG